MNIRRLAAVCVTASTVIGVSWGQQMPDTPMPDAWAARGTVSAIVQHGDTVYLGGSFLGIGPRTGTMAPIDAATGQAPAEFANVNDVIRICISDGAGGWYIGGDFTLVGGLQRNRLAHINAAGEVSDWNPNANSTVRALVLSDDASVVYAAGDFTEIGGVMRNCIAAIGVADGQATSWNPNANDPVYTLAVSTDDLVYAGGMFTAIGGEPRNYIAALDADDGSATGWNPNADDVVRVLLVSSDDTHVAVGGEFTNIGGAARNRIAALSAATGLADPWDASANGAVHALAVSSDDTLVYVGGEFTNIGGENRRGLAAVKSSDATVTAWNPALWGGLLTRVNSVALSEDDGTLYAGGNFWEVGGAGCHYVVALDAATALADDWLPVLNAEVLTVCPSADESTVLAGGRFSGVNWTSRNRLAAVDAATGELKDWDPGADDQVDALAISPDGATVYAGGWFTETGGADRDWIAAIDADTGVAEDWDPGANNQVVALAVSPDGATVYAGGWFTRIGGEDRAGIAAIDADTGVVSAWDPDANGNVNALAVSPDGATVYAGGWFTRIGGADRDRIAAIGASDNLATDWNPDADNEVLALAFSPDGATVYAGGLFNRMNIIAEDRNYLAALDAVTGIPTSWNPGANDDVSALAVSPDGATVYAGGRFTTIGGQPRNRLAAIAVADGDVTTWNPNADNEVLAVAVSPDSKILYAGGSFKSMSYPRSGFALFAPQYSLIYTADAHGTISGTATQTVYHGCDGEAVMAVAAAGYHFTQWSDAATANPRQDLSVTGDVAVTAAFALSLTPPDVPVGVTASAGTQLDKIRVAWSAAARANTYAVWRGLRADGADMVKLTDTADTSYDDAAVSAGRNYYYWIRADNAAGASDYSLSAHGFPGVVGPMVTANGLVGDAVRLNTGDPLTVAVQLNPGDYTGVPVDWWVAVLEQATGRWYYLNSAIQWTEFDGQLPNCRPVHMGGLFALPSTVVADGFYPGLGTYYIWFAVDYPMDGILDLSGQYLLSRVTVAVE